MEKFVILSVIVLLISACAKKPPKDYPITPVPFTDVQIKDNFWQPRMETNRTVTIPYDFKKCEETGRIDNFSKAGRLTEGEFIGIRYNDSDVYKVIEGAAYSLSLHPDPELEKYLDDLIAKIAAAQEDDGYLYTTRTIDPENPAKNAGKERWSYMIHSHELYNVGHMYEAAVAYYQATGKRSLLDVALKNANLIDSVFGPGKKHNPPGHQEIEIGLSKLYRITGEEKYLNLAKFFLDQRGKYIGRNPYDEYLGASYTQDHKPVIEQDEAVGHAVRAGYMYSGMADVAALTGDKNYIDAIDKIWDNVVSKKLYITGGIGARGNGEAFGDNYELPNLEAYNETCAAIANMFWNHRLFLLHGNAKFIDVLERTLYNGFLSGVGMSGSEFFYPNPLESDGRHKRSPWFDCACCPVNVVRFLPSLPGYVYAQKDDDLFVNLFMTSDATIKMKDNIVNLVQQADYPWEGKIRIIVNPEKPDDFAIHVRIPGWALGQPVPGDLYHYLNPTDEKVALSVNGEAVDFQLEKGFAVLKRNWKKGDVIEMNLPMPIRKVVAHDSVKADIGKLALERGPIVYCAEWVDNGGHVLNLMLPQVAELATEFRDYLLNGIQVIRGKALGLHSDGTVTSNRDQDFLAIPYYAWAHRGSGEMAVWLPYQESAAKALSFSKSK
ncbi:glycoside hydrolase family 127 protein [candidate division KSB1 bacterium]|nr:glycoside hydrolase family 127 protein [candidate division KSB1 bacterium]